MRRIVLHAGVDGEARVRAKALSKSLALPMLPLAAPLRVQLIADTAGNVDCWEAEFPTLTWNTARKVEAVR